MNKEALKRQLVGRARELATEVKALALQTERERKPNDSIMARMDEAGLFTILSPERWGGPELDLQTHHEIVEIVSQACMSTGWIVAFNSGHHVMAARFSEKAQAEMFANGPRCILVGGTTPGPKAKKVAGGWELTGRTPWGSGVMHGDWVLVAATDGQNDRFFAMPIGDIAIEDVWHYSAMAGTGSNDIVFDGVFVPDHRAELISDFFEGTTSGAQLYTNPLYNMPMLPFIYCEVAGVFTGGVLGAYEDFIEITRKRVITHSRMATNQKSHSHIHMGRAQANALTLQMVGQNILTETQSLLDSGSMSLDDRIRLKAINGLMVDHCRRAVNEMMNRAGASSFHVSGQLQRMFRDINMLSIHAYWDWETAFEQAGRHMVGLEPNNPLV